MAVITMSMMLCFRGHRVDGQWVFGGCEHRESGNSRNCFMVPVENRTAATLIPLIQRYIEPGSIIYSDCWKSYGGIQNLPEGYYHWTVNHSTNYKDPVTGACTNTIEGSWRHMKRSLPLNVRKGCYSSYLGEYLWRRKSRGSDLFLQFIDDIAKHYN